jgi:hypothetical protein
MKTYRINCFDDSDQFITTQEYLCSDDLEALDKATELCAANGVEVWDGARRVVWMYKGGVARVKVASHDELIMRSPLAALVAAPDAETV